MLKSLLDHYFIGYGEYILIAYGISFVLLGILGFKSVNQLIKIKSEIKNRVKSHDVS